MQKIALLLCTVLLFQFAAAQQYIKKDDPFQPYLNGKAPKIIKELGEEVQGNVKIRKLVFHSRDVKTPDGVVPNEIFAAVVRPVQPGQYPGLLVFHGGGGNAEINKATSWAAKGYIVVVLDEPGVANPDKVHMLTDGPWKKYKYAANRFRVTPDASASTIFDGALASLQALYLLRSQPDVIKDRIGVVGVSWGGYMTTMISGLANKYIRASFSVYGSGFYDLGSAFLKELDKMPPEQRTIWLTYLDAGRRAGNIKTPFFLAAAANDFFFHPPAVMQTLRSMKKAQVNQLFGPNASHKILLPGGTTKKDTSRPGWMEMEQAYFDYFLKDKGQPLPVITKAVQAPGIFKFHVTSPQPVTEALVYYSYADTTWPKRVWVPITAKATADGWYSADVPAEIDGKTFDWYANISDARPVSVSSYIIRGK